MARGRGGGRGRGRGGRRGRPPSTRTCVLDNVNVEAERNDEAEENVEVERNEEEVHMTKQQLKDIVANEVSRALHAALPIIVTEVRRAIEITDGQGGSDGTRGASGRKNTHGPEASDSNESDDAERGDRNAVKIEQKKGCSYKTFKGCNPPPFDGSENVLATFQWIFKMESVIDVSECMDDHAVMFATHSFVSEALLWWKTVKLYKGQRAINATKWDDLKKSMLEKFCPRNKLDKIEIEIEFLQLQAKDMTHREYTSKFKELAWLVPNLVTPEERRLEYYIQGLPPKVRTFVKAASPKTFESAVELSANLYDEVNALEPYSGEPKRKREDKLSMLGKGKDKFQRCFKCTQSYHTSRFCPKITCYNCQETGHYQSDRPSHDSSS